MNHYRYTTLVDGKSGVNVQSVDLIIPADDIRAAWALSSQLMDAMRIDKIDRVNPDVKLVKPRRQYAPR